MVFGVNCEGIFICFVVDSTIFVDLHTTIIKRGVFVFESKLNMCFNLHLSYILSLNLID